MRLLSRVAYFCRAWLSCPSLVSIISIVIFACSEEPRKRRDSYGGGGGGGDDGGGVQDGGHHHQHHHASTSHHHHHHHHHAVPVTTITMPVTMLFPCIATITTNKYEYCMNVYLTIHLWCFNLNVHTMYLYIYIYIYKSSASSLSVIYFGLSSQFLFQICVSSFN